MSQMSPFWNNILKQHHIWALTKLSNSVHFFKPNHSGFTLNFTSTMCSDFILTMMWTGQLWSDSEACYYWIKFDLKILKIYVLYNIYIIICNTCFSDNIISDVWERSFLVKIPSIRPGKSPPSRAMPMTLIRFCRNFQE